MDPDKFDENMKRFLVALFEKTTGDRFVQTSMYDIGRELGLDKNRSKKITEDLIGWELVEIRTLSGDIGITPAGAAEAQKLVVPIESLDGIGFKLGLDRTIDEDTSKKIDQILTDLKSQAGGLGLGFDPLTELIADLKTIDAQLMSSRPKTSIIRACFRSIQAVLEKAGATDVATRVSRFLGD